MLSDDDLDLLVGLIDEQDNDGGYRVKHRLSSSDSVQMSLRNVKIVKIPNLTSMRDTTSSTNWAVFGVVAALELKTTAKAAKMFLSLLLTDLNDHTFRLLAFDNAFETLKTGAEIGHVLCIGNGKRLPYRGTNDSNTSGTQQLVTISIDDPDQILQIGPCADFAICKGRKKDGKRCTIAVDERKGGYCGYHVQAAYKSMSSGRMDLQHGSARNQITSETSSAGNTRSRSATSSALAAIMKSNTKRPRLTTPDPVQESKAKHAAIACLSRSASYRTPKVGYVGGRPVYVKQTPVLVPVLSKSNPALSATALIDLDEDAPDPSVLRAVHRLAGKSLSAPDPNSANQPKKLMDISSAVNAGRTATATPVKAAPPPRPPNAITAALRAQVSGRKSINSHLVEQADREENETRFDMLQTREQMAEKMQSIRSQNVQAHVCHDCKYTLERQPQSCREMGHITTLVTVAKTWHKCKICSNRDVALGRHDPGRSCRRCGANHWVRTSMYQGKEVADTAKLQITNERRRPRGD